MKKLLSLLSILTISGTAVPTTIAASPYQKEETIKNSDINYQQTDNLEKLNRNKRDIFSDSGAWIDKAGKDIAIGTFNALAPLADTVNKCTTSETATEAGMSGAAGGLAGSTGGPGGSAVGAAAGAVGAVGTCLIKNSLTAKNPLSPILNK